MEMIDQFMREHEQFSSPSPVLASVIATCMTGPREFDEFKKQIAFVAMTSERDSYWGELALGVSPLHCNTNARVNILSMIISRLRDAGPHVLPNSAYQSILSDYLADSGPTNPVAGLQDRILTIAGIEH
jgi:hypothetical protein